MFVRTLPFQVKIWFLKLDAEFGGPQPKGPCRTKKYYDVVIYYRRSNSLFVEISCEFSPRKTRCFRDPPVVIYCRRSALLPP